MEIAIAIFGIIYAVLLWNVMSNVPIYYSDELIKKFNEFKKQQIKSVKDSKYKRI